MVRRRQSTLVIAILALLLSAGPILALTASARQTSYDSGGLGLALDDWDANYGPGEAGQTYMVYTLADGHYNVGVGGAERDVVAFIERVWDEGQGIPLEDAQDEADSLLPSDADFVEHFEAYSARILYGTIIERFQSKSLSRQLAGGDTKYGSNFVVIYDLEPASESYDYVVTTMTLAVAIRS
jgi:hypothetical protein